MPLVNPATLVYITPQTTANQSTLPFALEGDATFTAATAGTGGWQIVDRPRQVAATQWYDRPPWQLQLTCLMTAEIIFGVVDGSIEAYCNEVESWFDPIPGTLQPPVLQVSGPVPGTSRQWVGYALEQQEAIRDPVNGLRVQQRFKFTLYEFNPPLSSLSSAHPAFTPAGLAQQQITAQQVTSQALGGFAVAASTRSYTVRAGDTLQSIAATQLGNYNLWSVIAGLNNIRDPSSLTAGQIIYLPNQVSG